MIASLVLLLPLATSRDVADSDAARQTSVPVRFEQGAAVAAPLLAGPLGLVVVIEVPGRRWCSKVRVRLRDRLALRASGVRFCPLVGEAYVVRDTLFLPLVWLTDCVHGVRESVPLGPVAGLLTETGARLRPCGIRRESSA
jgi:hypothetical protein